jgi:lysophospholipase L1-like esterase
LSSERGIVAPLVLVAAIVLVAIGVAGLIVVINSEDEPPPDSGSGEYELRAIGDSVTAGWGHYPGSGKEVPSFPLLLGGCVPPPTPNGRCQSPREVAYPAVFARARGIPRARPGFENLAVAGADPIDWLQQPFEDELERVVADDPDLTVLTLGANPLLSNFLTPATSRGRCLHTDRIRACIDDALRTYQVVERLSQVYQRLLQTPPDGKRGLVVVFQYHRTSPATVPPDRVEILFGKLRAAISAAVADARARRPEDAERLLLLDPPSFDGHHCRSADPWVLAADTCIHPSAAGHEQFARALDEAVPRPAAEE